MSKVISFKRTAYKFDVYGESVELRAPTVDEYKIFEEKGKKKNAKEFDLMCDFLISLGMKKKTLQGLEPVHIGKIIECVTKGDNGKK